MERDLTKREEDITRFSGMLHALICNVYAEMPSSPTKVKSSLLFSAHTNLPFPSLFFISAQYATQERRYHSDAITNSYREFVTPGEKSLLLPWTTAPSD